MKHRLLIILADDESEPYSVLKLYDLDFDKLDFKGTKFEGMSQEWDCVNYNDGYYDTDEDRKQLILDYFETYNIHPEYEARYVDKASEDLRASYPTYEMALAYFEQGERIK